MANENSWVDTHKVIPINNNVIKHQQFFDFTSVVGGGAGSGDTLTMYVILGTSIPVKCKKYWYINYVNYWTNDTNHTNAFANKMDYPYLSINAKNWTDYPGQSTDQVPLIMEENLNEYSVPVQWRARNIYLGHWDPMPAVGTNPTLHVRYFCTATLRYKMNIEFLESLVPIEHPDLSSSIKYINV